MGVGRQMDSLSKVRILCCGNIDPAMTCVRVDCVCGEKREVHLFDIPYISRSVVQTYTLSEGEARALAESILKSLDGKGEK